MSAWPGTLAALPLLALAALFAAPAGAADEAQPQTRQSFAAAVDPICKANTAANRRIMAGARQRVARDALIPAAGQFQRLARSIGGMERRLAVVPPPVGDEARVGQWLRFIRLLRQRIGNTAKLYREAGRAPTETKREWLEIKATHEGIHAERAGLTANNVTVSFPFRECRFRRIG